MFRSLLVLAAMSTPAFADGTYVHAELDPLTFVNGGYGAQLGVRPATHLRFAIASFDLHVPDVVSQINGNDGFDVRVLPSGAFYALYYLRDAGSDGLAFGGSVRYLRESVRDREYRLGTAPVTKSYLQAPSALTPTAAAAAPHEFG